MAKKKEEEVEAVEVKAPKKSPKKKVVVEKLNSDMQEIADRKAGVYKKKK